jgi:hypothetical protein
MRRPPPSKTTSRPPPVALDEDMDMVDTPIVAPPSRSLPSPPAKLTANTTQPPASKTVVSPTGNCLTDGLAAAGLTSLLAAITQAGLSSTFKGLDNVTLLAPSDDAFSALTSSLTKVPTGQLRTMLYYHIVEGGWRSRVYCHRSAPATTPRVMPRCAAALVAGAWQADTSVRTSP